MSESSAAPRRRYNFDDPKLAARAGRASHLAMAPKRAEDRIRKLVEAAPPLTAEQKIRLAALLLSAPGPDGERRQHQADAATAAAIADAGELEPLPDRIGWPPAA